MSSAAGRSPRRASSISARFSPANTRWNPRRFSIPPSSPHPDQSGLAEGELRFILSLRATGEGHISSIEFRTGVIRADHAITIEEPSRFVTAPVLNPNPTYRKNDLPPQADGDGLRERMVRDGHEVARRRLHAQRAGERRCAAPPHGDRPAAARSAAHHSNACAGWRSRTTKSISTRPSPSPSASFSPSRRMRATAWKTRASSASSRTTAASSTTPPTPPTMAARSSRSCSRRPTSSSFRARTLNGRAVQNKGMAFFPRRIDGRYAMISRQDDENLFLMFSDNPHFWSDPQLLRRPAPCLGSGEDRQLRLADRDRGRLAGHHPRRRADAQILHRRAAARPATIPPRSSPSCASRCCRPTATSAKATCPTSSTPAARCCTAASSSCRMG